MKPKDRLKQARAAAGYETPSDAARAHPRDINVNTLISNENGNRDISRKAAEKYARIFGVTAGWLLYGEDVTTITAQPPISGGIPEVEQPNAGAPKKIVAGLSKIPVYGQAVGGVDGEFVMNGSLLYEVLAPPNLSETSGAYAVVVSGDSMSPRYEDGETVFVDPKRRPKRGDYVIAQVKIEENGALLAYVKKFERRNAEELVLSQFNPPKELRFQSRNVETVHVIVGMLTDV